MKHSEILFDLHALIYLNQIPTYSKMISERYKVVIRIINKFTLMGQRKSKVGCAVMSENHSNMQRTSDALSIFTSEAKSVDLPLDFIRTRHSLFVLREYVSDFNKRNQ